VVYDLVKIKVKGELLENKEFEYKYTDEMEVLLPACVDRRFTEWLDKFDIKQTYHTSTMMNEPNLL